MPPGLSRRKAECPSQVSGVAMGAERTPAGVDRGHRREQSSCRQGIRGRGGEGMARTPLASLLQDAVAEVALEDARSHDPARLPAPRRRRRSRSHCSRAICARGEGGGLGAEDRCRRRRPRRALVRLSAPAGGIHRPGLRGLGSRRREVLDRTWRVRGRADLRARRRADRPGPQPDSQPRPGAGAEARQPAPRRGQRHRAAGLLRREAVPLRADHRRHQAGLAEDPRRHVRSELPDAVRQLHRARSGTRQPLDRRLDRGVRCPAG